jgi:hypothetical protein
MLPSEYPEIANYPTIKYVFEKQVDMLFNDLRCMLKSPLPGCAAGYNLTIVIMILNLYSGFSRRLYRPIGVHVDNERFVQMLIDFFPWDNSMPNPEECSKMLYTSVRNPLTHELGIKGSERVKIYKNGRSSDNEILQLEENVEKPQWLGQIIMRITADSSTEWLVSVTGLYWATHRLLHNLLADEGNALRAEQRLLRIVLRQN